MKNDEFWSEFADTSGRLAVAFRQGFHQEVFDQVNAMLESNGCPFCFDITESEGTCHLIFSPEGDHQEATAIDALVRSAPLIPGWEIFGRRQRKDQRDLRAMIRHLYLIDLDHCKFKIERTPYPFVTMYIPEQADLTPEEQNGLANTLLWHAIGEGHVMEAMIKCEVKVGIPGDRRLLTNAEFIKECNSKLGLR